MRSYLFLLAVLVCLNGCWWKSTPAEISLPYNEKPLTLHFQNMTGLELHAAGCSILNHGGIERYCQFSKDNPADFTFQIGPAFSHFLEPNPENSFELEQTRKLLWKEWNYQKVAFYSVDAQDLIPNRKDFEKITKTGKIALLSANLVAADSSNLLYQPYFRLKWGNHSLVFISFTEPFSSSGPDWKVLNPSAAFNSLLAKLPQDALGYYVVGSLTPQTRDELAKISPKKLFFLGAELSRQNSIKIDEEGTYLVAKTPDLGRGLGILLVSQANLPFQENMKFFNSLNHDFKAKVLRKATLTDVHCATLEGAQECQIRKLGKKEGAESPCEDK